MLFLGLEGKTEHYVRHDCGRLFFFFFFAVVHAVYRDQSRPRRISRLSGLETLYRSVSYKSYFLCCVCFVKYIEKDGGRVEQGVRVKRGG